MSAYRERITSYRSCRLGLVLAAAFMSLAGAPPAAATDLLYILRSPSFGGDSAGALAGAQIGQNLKSQHDAAVAAAARAATTPPGADPNAAFVSAITSQLTGLVAQSVAQRIANSQNGQAGTIQSGNVVITYVNSDGQLSVTITSPTGSTVLQIPTGA